MRFYRAALVVTCGLLAGCMSPEAVRSNATSKWLHQPISDVLAQLGTPDGVYPEGEVRKKVEDPERAKCYSTWKGQTYPNYLCLIAHSRTVEVVTKPADSHVYVFSASRGHVYRDVSTTAYSGYVGDTPVSGTATTLGDFHSYSTTCELRLWVGAKSREVYRVNVDGDVSGRACSWFI